MDCGDVDQRAQNSANAYALFLAPEEVGDYQGKPKSKIKVLILKKLKAKFLESGGKLNVYRR